MGMLVGIAKPLGGTTAAAPTFFVCGGSNGVSFVTVQIFAFAAGNDDLEQLQGQKQTVAVDGHGNWSTQFTLNTNPPPAPAYVATAAGYTTNTGAMGGTVTGSVVAQPVVFFCNTGGDSTDCFHIPLLIRLLRCLGLRR
jgi:hypothetical protein